MRAATRTPRVDAQDLDCTFLGGVRVVVGQLASSNCAQAGCEDRAGWM